VSDRPELRPDDRVLFLSPPPLEAVAGIAASLDRGVVVVLAGEERLGDARRRLKDVQNAMIVPASPEEIPWQENFFTVVVDPGAAWNDAERVVAEIARVLGPGGELRLSGSSARQGDLLAAASFVQIDPGVYRKLV
jgi:hypothetical protein